MMCGCVFMCVLEPYAQLHMCVYVCTYMYTYVRACKQIQ